ncbi:NAD(P)-binding protein [Paracoccus cavernae]|uniref:NAD(P)-binding protein n=1 Tax=Paracoccus cavernae TaxID=1571207 RepID=UPI003632E5F7
MNSVNIAILGAGAAGLFCAGSLAGSGKRVMVLDHAAKPGEKIRISGAGGATLPISRPAMSGSSRPIRVFRLRLWRAIVRAISLR